MHYIVPILFILGLKATSNIIYSSGRSSTLFNNRSMDWLSSKLSSIGMDDINYQTSKNARHHQ